MTTTLGIAIGLLSGIVAGFIVSLYFRDLDRQRLVIKYANQTADIAFEIMMEAGRCLKGEDTAILTRLITRSQYLHREFDGKISDPLQQAIAQCNEGVHKTDEALRQPEPHTPLSIAYHKMPDYLLNIWDAIVDFETALDKKQQRDRNKMAISLVLLLIILAVIMVYEYRLNDIFRIFS
jgi:hypothetical protein